MKLPFSKQSGTALIVALVALVVLTILGVTTMSDVLNQSTVVRNEQFRQNVFYAANSELNVQISDVNLNDQSDDDEIIDDLLDQSLDGQNMVLELEADEEPGIFTSPDDVILSAVSIDGNTRTDSACPGEQIGAGTVIAGNLNVTATLDDGRGSIQSIQSQRYMYCWP